MLSGPSYYSSLSSGDKNVPPYVISSVKTMLSAFQRQTLENAEEESRRVAKTVHGEHLGVLFFPRYFLPLTCVELFVTLVVFPVRAGAECGAVQEGLSAPEGGEPVQATGAETGTHLKSGAQIHTLVSCSAICFVDLLSKKMQENVPSK